MFSDITRHTNQYIIPMNLGFQMNTKAERFLRNSSRQSVRNKTILNSQCLIYDHISKYSNLEVGGY